MNHSPPIVLILAGNDPTGGAGLGADIQTLAAQGCHAAPVVTCITVQNTHNVIQCWPLTGEQVLAQAETVLADMSIVACKIGLLGSVDIVEAVSQLLRQHPHLPVVLDPILAAGGGKLLSTVELRQAVIKLLLPLVTVVTPNSQEARILTATDTLNTAAWRLLDYGCQYVGLTGTHENTTTVVNRLYGHGQLLQSWEWERLPKTYHGSGCTLAASLAGQLALGKPMLSAVESAQRYTWDSLKRGFQAGHGQTLPLRV